MNTLNGNIGPETLGKLVLVRSIAAVAPAVTALLHEPTVILPRFDEEWAEINDEICHLVVSWRQYDPEDPDLQKGMVI